jgi:hypothetical protein
MERVTRIELVTKAWEAAVIPFHHTRRAVLDTRDMKRRQAGPFNQRARLRRRPPSSPLPAVLNNSSGNGVFERRIVKGSVAWGIALALTKCS